MVKILKNVAQCLATLLMMTSCSEHLLTPITITYDTETGTETVQETATETVQNTDTGTGTNADSATSVDTDTQSDSNSDSDSDSHPDSSSNTQTDSDNDTQTDSDNDTQTDSSSDTQTDSNSDTQTDSNSDTQTDASTDSDFDTDTYEYTDIADFRHVGYASEAPAEGIEFPNDLSVTNSITVTSVDALTDAIANKGDAPLAIYMDGRLTADTDDDQIAISNVQDLYVIGQNNANLSGVGFNISESENILIQNVTIHHVPGDSNDGISIGMSRHIWIDHCEIYNDTTTAIDYDSLLDITEGSDYITVSWNYFHENTKGLIVGNSDDNADADAGKLNVTYHHNIFRNISSQTSFSVVSFRFGNAHVFNNFFINDGGGGSIGISSRMGACVRAELNLFDGIPEPLKTDESGDDGEHIGRMQAIQNIDKIGGVPPVTPTCTLVVPYDEYLDTLLDPASLEGKLAGNVGAIL